MSAPVFGFTCGCCDNLGYQLQYPFVEPDLGLVCDGCKLQLRFAQAKLKSAGLRFCTHTADIHERRALLPVKRKGQP